MRGNAVQKARLYFFDFYIKQGIKNCYERIDYIEKAKW